MLTRNTLTALSLMLIVSSVSPSIAQTVAKRVALLVGPTQDRYLGSFTTAFTGTAKQAELDVTVLSTPFDAALQAQQIDDAISQKFDMVVIQTVSQQAIIPPLTRAKAAGIPVMTVIVPLAPAAAALSFAYVGSNQVKLGELAGEAMAAALTASGRTSARVAVIAGSMAEGIGPMRLAGFTDALKRTPGFEVVATEDSKWNPANGERQAGQLLARFAGQGGLDGIYGMNDLLANAAIQSAQAAGMGVGPGKGALVVVGGNCQAPGIRNLIAGKMAATVLLLPAVEGQTAAAMVKAFFDKRSVPTQVYVPFETITKANVDTYAQPCSY